MAKKAVSKRAVKRKTTAKKRTTKVAKKRATKVARKRTTAVKPRRSSPKSAGLSGRSKLLTRQLSLVKAARKEGEQTARKKLLDKITKIFRSGKKRKTPAKKRKPADNPFVSNYYRGGRKKKETTEQRLKRLSRNVGSTRDQVLLGIANGSFKFKWTSVAKETGYGNGERKKMLSILDNKGYTINGLAQKIWEDNDGSYGRGNSDDVIRDEIIDILQSVSSRSDALNLLDRGQGDAPF